MAHRYHTRLVHPQTRAEGPFDPLSTPIYQSANFAQARALEAGPYDYSRTDNPTRSVLEAVVADLHGARDARAFVTGMAAVGTVLRSLPVGARVLVGDDVYGGTYRLLQALADDGRLRVDWVDTSDAEGVTRALEPPTALLLVESPGNPMLRISDLRFLAAAARRAGALLAVDNSTMSPHLQRPLELGADIVIESATKFLGGHGDLLAGVVATSDPEVASRTAWLQNAEGTGLAPFDSWLLLRSIKTLAVRVDRQQRSAIRLASRLENHPRVARVHYPGLERHPGSGVHAGQAAGPGAVLSLELEEPSRAPDLVDACELFRIAVSFGGTSSLVSLPESMSHAPVPPTVRARRRLPEGLVRLAVGLEDPDDLTEDLERALAVSADRGPGG